MRRNGFVNRLVRVAVCAIPGAAIFGTSCAADIRKSIVAAGLDFVEGTAGTILSTVIPVEDFVGGE